VDSAIRVGTNYSSRLDPRIFSNQNVIMNVAKTALLLAAMAIIVLACGERKKPGGLTVISVLPESGDFGVVRQGETATYYLSIENLGPGNIMLLGVDGGCPGPAVKFDRAFLRPAEVTRAELTFDTTNFSGKLQQQLAIRTDNVEMPLFPFQVSGMVKPGFLITPQQYWVSRAELENSKKSVVSSLANLSDKTVTVRSISTTAGHVSALLDAKGKIPWKLSPGQSVDIKIDIMPVDADAVLSAKVIIQTKGVFKNRHEISVIEK